MIKFDKIFIKKRYKNKNEKKLLDIKRFLEEKLKMESINSHNLIEYFMIETNKVVGEKLYKTLWRKSNL